MKRKLLFVIFGAAALAGLSISEEGVYNCLVTKEVCYINTGGDASKETAYTRARLEKELDEDISTLIVADFTLNEDSTLPDDILTICGGKDIHWLNTASGVVKHRQKRGWLFGRRSSSSSTSRVDTRTTNTNINYHNQVSHTNVNHGSGNIINFHVAGRGNSDAFNNILASLGRR